MVGPQYYISRMKNRTDWARAMAAKPMQVTITLDPDVAETVNAGVAAGRYGSPAEAVTEALRGWQDRQATSPEQLAYIRRELQKGLDDIAAGRVEDFSAEKIIEEGRKRLAKRSRCG
jgi:antitoxin ParD1/3/4